MTATCYPQWGVSSGPWKKDQGDAVRANSRSWWVTHSNHLVAPGCVPMECVVESIWCSDEEGDTGRKQYSVGI